VSYIPVVEGESDEEVVRRVELVGDEQVGLQVVRLYLLVRLLAK